MRGFPYRPGGYGPFPWKAFFIIWFVISIVIGVLSELLK